MKTYSELYFNGSSTQLEVFINQIGDFAVDKWKLRTRTERNEDYLYFDYMGNKVEKATVCIYLGKNIEIGQIKVGNIIPQEKNQLSIEEYNEVLLQFYNDVILPYMKKGTELNIIPPTDDNFNPLSVISKCALEKLRLFCSRANKSTGSSHPYDQERWFDFICQTVDDGMTFDSSQLARFLQDETYWGEKPKDFIGAMGDYAWDEEKAWELASEYEQACQLISYYKSLKGL